MALPSALLPLVVLLGCSGLITAAVAWFAAEYRGEVGADWFLATMLLSTVWTAAALLQVVLHGWRLSVGLEVVSIALSLVVPVTWFGFVLAYAGHERLLRPPRGLALWIVPALSIAALVAFPWTDLYLASTPMTVGTHAVGVTSDSGPLAYLGVLYIAGLFLVGIWLLGRLVAREEGLFSRQALWLILGTLAPVVLALASQFGGTASVPLIPVGFAVLGLAYARGLFTHRMLDVVPAARRIGIRKAVADLDDGIVVLDDEGDVVEINERACEQFGCDPADALGRHATKIHPALNPPVDCDGPREIRLVGEVLEVSGTAVTDSRDRLVGHALVVRTVTDQRTRQERLAVLNRIIRHNLRNDMTVVRGHVDELARRGEDDERTRRGEDGERAGVGEDGERARADDGDVDVESLADTVRSTTDGLIAVAEKAHEIDRTLSRPPTPREVSLDAFLAGIVREVEAEHGDCPIAIDVSPDLTVAADVPTLELVVRNLIENAVVHGAGVGDDAGPARAGSGGAGSADRAGRDGTGVTGAPDGGRDRSAANDDGGPSTAVDDGDVAVSPAGDGGDGTISPAGGEDDAPVTVRARREGDRVTITVADDGPGIPEQEVRVLQRGGETALEHGTGLGLWLVRWGATRLQATLAFDTSDGTEVQLALPTTAAESDEDEPTTDEQSGQDQRG